MSAVENTPAAWSARAASASSSAQASGWSGRGQVQRFLAALSHLDLRSGDLLLDYGCGDGALSVYLPEGVRYYGLDTAPGMLGRARRDHPSGVYRDHLPIGEEFEHIVCIGPFNLADNWSREETWNTIELLWKRHTRRTLIVSLYAGADPETLDYAPDWALSLAQSLSECYVIDRSYLPNDLMVVLKR